MVAYNRRMGSGVPGVMDYAAPYIELAFALDDREQRKEDRLAAEEQRRIENDIRNKQLGFQENANKIAMDTFNLNKQQQEIENASKPASQRPLSPELIKNLSDEMAKKDTETGINLYGAYAEPMKALSDSAGKKPALESYYDFTSSLNANKDAIIASLQAEIPKAKGDPQKISALNKAIADVQNGGEAMVSKFFPGIHAMVKAETAKANQARLDKLAEKDVEGSKAKREAYLKTLTTEYDDLSKSMSKYLTGEKDEVSGQPIVDVMSVGKIKRRMMAIKDEINNIESPAIGGRPVNIVQPQQPQTQPAPRPMIGGNVAPADLVPQNGAAISRVPVFATGPRMTAPGTGITQPPPVEDDANYIAGLIAKGAKNGKDPFSIPEIKELQDDFFRRNPTPEAQAAFKNALESQGIKGGDIKGAIISDKDVTEKEIQSAIRLYNVDRPTAIVILKNQKEKKSAAGKAIKEGAQKGISALSRGAEKGFDFLSRSNNSSAF